MRLLIFGHWSATGFGVVTRELGERFVAAGVDVRVIAVNHRGDPARGPLAGRVWPAGMIGDDFGGGLSHAALEGTLWRRLDREDEWRPDRVLLIGDVSSATQTVLGGGRGFGPFATLPTYHYCPVEGPTTTPALWRSMWENLRPVAMSRFGAKYMTSLLERDVPMIYHGISPAFRPLGVDCPARFEGKVINSMPEAKLAFGLDPQRRYILRTDRHVERKAYDAFLRSLRPALETYPDVDVVIHCKPRDEAGDLGEEVAAQLPEHLWPRMKFTNLHDSWVGLSTEGLVALYNVARDGAYVSTTMGEGFGLTLAEAAACGVQVVTTDAAAGPEVCGPGAILVPPLRDAYGVPVEYRSRYQMRWAVPDVTAFGAAIVRALARPSEARERGAAGRRHVLANFSWDRAVAEFLALFEVADGRADLAV